MSSNSVGGDGGGEVVRAPVAVTPRLPRPSSLLVRAAFACLAAASLCLPAGASGEGDTGRTCLVTTPDLLDRLVGPRLESIKRSTSVELVLVARDEPSLSDVEREKCQGLLTLDGLVQAVSRAGSLYEAESLSSWQAHAVMFDTGHVVVHPSNPTRQLKREQLNGLAAGALDNWRALGWEDMPVTMVLSRELTPAQFAFNQKIMAGGFGGSVCVEVESMLAQVDYVSRHRGAFAVVGSQVVRLAGTKQRVKLVAGPDLLVPVWMITRVGAGGPVAQLLTFFEGEEGRCCYDEQ